MLQSANGSRALILRRWNVTVNHETNVKEQIAELQREMQAPVGPMDAIKPSMLSMDEGEVQEQCGRRRPRNKKGLKWRGEHQDLESMQVDRVNTFWTQTSSCKFENWVAHKSCLVGASEESNRRMRQAGARSGGTLKNQGVGLVQGMKQEAYLKNQRVT